jgi:hypothetical protein
MSRIIWSRSGTANYRPVLSDPAQRAAVKLINNLDSGLNIRTPEGYRKLMNGLGFEVETRVFHDLLRIPYDHVVMIARNETTQSS